MNLQERELIRVSPDKLFSYLIDVNNRKDFIPAMEEVIMLSPVPIREGSQYIEVANIGGMRLETTYQVMAFEMNKRLTAKTLKSIFPIQADMLLIEKGTSTILTIELEFELGGVFRLVSGVVRGIVRRQAKDILGNIKQALENT